MGTVLRYFNDDGEPNPIPELITAPADLIERAFRRRRWLERVAAANSKRVEDLTRGEISPDDLTNARADRGTHADPVGNAVVSRLNDWHQKETRRLRFSDGRLRLTTHEILRLKEAGCGSDIDPRALTCDQVRAFLNGAAR